MSSLLQRTKGNFAVVIHGDRDCANVLQSGIDFPGTHRFFTTNLTDRELLKGGSLKRLEDCLQAVAKEMKPEAIFLLGTCSSVLLGDELTPSAKRIAKETGIPITPLPGAGMRFVPQSQLIDDFASLMLQACLGLGLGLGLGLNLIGFHPGDEILAMLPVNTILDTTATMTDWRRLPEATTNLVLDEDLYATFLEQATNHFNQRTVRVPFPLGHKSTTDFLTTATGRKPDNIPAPPPAAFKNKRLAYNIGSTKNLDPRTLALEGLTDLPAFEELGFSPLILVQGNDHPDRLKAIRQTLDGLGIPHPFAVFSDTVFFGNLCEQHDIHLAYASDHLREQANAANIPFLPQGTLKPGYSGIEDNLHLIRTLL
jgi:nitrogenase molybdenum-iron protein alpha/beta subunit